jgi:hypothetical protein
VALLVSACGGGGEAGAQVASLAADDDASGTAEAAQTEVDSQQASLDFAQCLRDNGLDVADPTFDEEGNLEGGLFGGGPGGPGAGSGEGLDPGSGEAQAAFEACGDLLEGVGFGPGGGGGGFDPDEIEATLVGFTECLRDEGLDVGDLTLGGPDEGSRMVEDERQNELFDHAEDRQIGVAADLVQHALLNRRQKRQFFGAGEAFRHERLGEVERLAFAD